jgi:hypothetical protein
MRVVVHNGLTKHKLIESKSILRKSRCRVIFNVGDTDDINYLKVLKNSLKLTVLIREITIAGKKAFKTIIRHKSDTIFKGCSDDYRKSISKAINKVSKYNAKKLNSKLNKSLSKNQLKVKRLKI